MNDQPTNGTTPNGSPPAPAAQCSAVVYSGPHYGRVHKIIRRTDSLVWVNYQGDNFAVPACDVEEMGSDSQMGMTWWNGMSQPERHEIQKQANALIRGASVAQAWRLWRGNRISMSPPNG